MRRQHADRTGFTLIELMIVVAIVGILAVVAIPNFLRFQQKSRSAEGKTNLEAIRTAELSHFTEFGFFIGAVASPIPVPGPGKAPFVNTTGPGTGFDRLGWAPEGWVYFQYGVSAPSSNQQQQQGPTAGFGVTSGSTSFFAMAVADIDADTHFQSWGYRHDVTDLVPPPGIAVPCQSLPDRQVGPCDLVSGASVF